MNDIDLDDIRARAEAATEGPWVPRDSLDGYSSAVRGPHGWVAAMRSTPRREMTHEELGPLRPCRRREDAEFIAHAREDVPALLDEVEQLRAQVQAVRHILSSGYADFADFQADLREAVGIDTGGAP